MLRVSPLMTSSTGISRRLNDSSRRIFASGGERKGHLAGWGGTAFEATKGAARRAEFDSTSDGALAAPGTFRKGRDIDECSEDGASAEAKILEALACEHDDFGECPTLA